MSLVPNRALSGASANQGYVLSRSLRFRSSASAYLSRTPASASNRKTWTWSGWVKFGDVSTTGRCLFGTLVTSNYTTIGINVSGQGTATIGMESVSGTTIIVSRAYTNAVIRDPSAWYHIVFAVDTTNATAADRLKIYFNGVRMSVTEPYQAALNADHFINQSGVSHAVMSGYTTAYCCDGYLAEVNFIDGQALTPSSFGQTDAVTGVWQPVKYTGTYGTNGFYLPFTDNTSATTLAYDKSGNGNNWTANNISTTAGATYDSMTDVPTLTSATAANFAVLNPLYTSGTFATFSNGNLTLVTPSTTGGTSRATMEIPQTGKWYWEFTPTVNGDQSYSGIDGGANSIFYYGSTGQKFVDGGAGVAYGATYTNNDVIGVAVDSDSGSVTFYKNNVSQGVIAYTILGKSLFPAFQDAQTTSTTINVNFGQRPFSYTPPTGFKALNTFNLPDPTIKKPNQYMDATLYTGTGSALSVVNAGGFQPDLVWVKARSAAYLHELVDSVRGASKYLSTNSTNTEVNDTPYSISALNANGFTQAGNQAVGENGTTYVGWQWKKGATPGFDIVTYTGTGSAQAINHSLGVAPKMVIYKARSVAGYSWTVWHTAYPATQYLILDGTQALATNIAAFNNTAPTSTQFSVGTSGSVNAATYVAYLFAEIAGYSKFGSYTGNGSADGPFVYCGFRPKYVMVKVSSGTADDWYILDSVRNTYNATNPNYAVYADLSNAELNYSAGFLDFTSNGFKLRSIGAGSNTNGNTYIYAAFAENPFKYSNAR